MKTRFTVFLAMALLASTSFAQNSSTAKMNVDDSISSKGFRISLVRPFLEAELNATYKDESLSETKKVEETTGLSLGYASLPVQDLGWTSNATYLNIGTDGVYNGVARIDGNLAYAFNSIVNLKGGINVSKFVTGEFSENMKAGIGFQGGLGVQLTRNFGLDLGYTQMNQSASSDGVNVGVRMAGIEIGLNGTF